LRCEFDEFDEFCTQTATRRGQSPPKPSTTTTNILLAEKSFLPQRQQQVSQYDLLAISYWLPATGSFAIVAI
jgi:hypothetical protein